MHALFHGHLWWLAAPLRWLVLVGLAVAGGASAFDLFALRETAYAPNAEPALRALRGWTVDLRCYGLALAAPANVAALGAQLTALTGLHLAWGIAWLVRMAAIGVAVRVIRRPVAAACATAVALLTLSASGHAVMAGQPLFAGVAVVADWLHLSAVTVWAGGVAVFATGLQVSLAPLAPRDRGPFIAALIQRFSVVALTALTFVALTGAYAAVIQLGSLDAVVDTAYGWVVIAKVILLLCVLGIAFAHDREGRGEPEGRFFVGTVRAEACVMLAILALSALLTSLRPPSGL